MKHVDNRIKLCGYFSSDGTSEWNNEQFKKQEVSYWLESWLWGGLFFFKITTRKHPDKQKKNSARGKRTFWSGLDREYTLNIMEFVLCSIRAQNKIWRKICGITWRGLWTRDASQTDRLGEFLEDRVGKYYLGGACWETPTKDDRMLNIEWVEPFGPYSYFVACFSKNCLPMKKCVYLSNLNKLFWCHFKDNIQ